MPSAIMTTIREWRDVLLRLQQIGRNDQGASILEIRVLTIRGQPVCWFKPEKKNIEPASIAGAFCDALSEEIETE